MSLPDIIMSFFQNFNQIKEKNVLDKTVLIGFTGSWIALDEKEYIQYKSGKIDPSLSSRLEEKGIIATERNKDKLMENYRLRKPQLYGPTSLHIIVTTLRCNSNCIYCHASSRSAKEKKFDMTIEAAKKTVDFIFQSPAMSLFIEFQGGEPLLNFDVIKYIIEYSNEINKIHNKTLSFSLVTNLYYMTEDILEYLESHKVNLSTSLDGPKELHNKNRPAKKDSYHIIVSWIIKIKKRNKIRLSGLLTTTSFSLSYPREIVDTYKRLGFSNVWFRKLNDIGVASKSWNKISYTAEEFFGFWKAGVEHAYKKGIDEYSSNLLLKKNT